jgi:hypothetical protein
MPSFAKAYPNKKSDGHLATSQILDALNFRAGENGVAAHRIIHRHDDFEFPASGIRGNHLIVGHRGGIQLAALHRSRHDGVVAEVNQLNVQAILFVITIGGGAINGAVTNPSDYSHVHRRTGRRQCRHRERGRKNNVSHGVEYLTETPWGATAILRRGLPRGHTPQRIRRSE